MGYSGGCDPPIRPSGRLRRRCQLLVIVILNDEVEEIGACAFFSCTSLEEIIIPNAVKTIECGAFWDRKG